MKPIHEPRVWLSAIAVALGLGSAASAQTGVDPLSSLPSAGPSASTLRFLMPGSDSTQPPRVLEPAQVPSLQRSIALALRDVSRERALEEIGRAADLNLVYASDLIPAFGSVTLTVTAIPVSAALDTVLSGLSVDVVVEPSGTIVLTPDVGTPIRQATARIQLSDQLSSLPVDGAIVSLFAGDGTPAAEGLTDAHGIGLLSLQEAGPYHVRVRRIGYLPFTSELLILSVGDTTRIGLTIPSIAVTLPSVTAAAKPKACRQGDEGRLASSELWDQIQIALEATELTTSDTSVHTLRRNIDRLALPKGELGGVVSASQSLGRDRPFFARSPAELSTQGYVTTDSLGMMTFDGPDVSVLLSPEFENDHCFSVIAGTGPTAGLIGLSFTPVADRTTADISGVLWVAEPTARLEYLDYRYVNVRSPVPAPLAGGQVIFERLPHGEWIVRDWVVHTPDLPITIGGQRIDRTALLGYLDVGGTARGVARRHAAPNRPPASGRDGLPRNRAHVFGAPQRSTGRYGVCIEGDECGRSAGERRRRATHGAGGRDRLAPIAGGLTPGWVVADRSPYSRHHGSADRRRGDRGGWVGIHLGHHQHLWTPHAQRPPGGDDDSRHLAPGVCASTAGGRSRAETGTRGRRPLGDGRAWTWGAALRHGSWVSS